jgi:hypothetical protein
VPKYKVTLYYTTCAVIEVEAESKEEALIIAQRTDTGSQVLEGLQGAGDDIEQLED